MHNTDECNINNACHKGHMCHECKKGSHKSKKLCGFLSDKSKDPNTIINKNIVKAFSHQEKKEKANLNKVDALSISSGSNAGDSNSKSKVSHTSDKGLDSM
eukprot:2443893-Ditylum_brightwellii.AAC.1